MSRTPICDFVEAYRQSNAMRLHMPGHKGGTVLGPEALDITEIEGADVLYHANGIIRQSEQIASELFETARTLYSAEGSSLCIRAMLHLIALNARAQGKRPLILAARNAHKVFITAAALLDIDVCWLYPEQPTSVVSCKLKISEVERALQAHQPSALYVTSPDYLGNCADIRALSSLCHQYGALLAVDNAHGAYLKFLPASRHPMDLGADICCDSAHKTLPVLTGGAYLHIARTAPQTLVDNAANAMALFASTSPSYLILQSLDRANRYLSEGYADKLADFTSLLARARAEVCAYGYGMPGDEPLKWTLAPKCIGWRGDELAGHLMHKKMVVEFADPDFVVMMFTPEMEEAALRQLVKVLTGVPRKAPIADKPPAIGRPRRRMSPREALFAPQEIIPAAQAAGRVLAAPSVTCPPAVPVVACGEEITASAVDCFAYYGIESCSVVIE